MNRKGMLVIISGPSGSGKGTIVKRLLREDFALSISMTTRGPRPGEEHGRDYFFCTKEQFIEMREKGEFLEHAEFVGNMYGTPKQYVEDQITQGRSVILEIDVVGALQIKAKFNDSVLIFLMPPSFKELTQRLIDRKTEDLDTIERRMKRARTEVDFIERYDYFLINDTIDNAVSRIHTIVDSEYLKPHRNKYLIEQFTKGED